MSTSLVECTPRCESFRCTQGKGTLKFRTHGGKKTAWCTAFDDECDGAWCQYSKCAIKKMVDGGKCKGRGEKQIIAESPIKDVPIDDPSVIPEKYAKKLRSKTKF